MKEGENKDLFIIYTYTSMFVAVLEIKNCVVYRLDEQVKALALIPKFLCHWQLHPCIFLASLLSFSLVFHNLEIERNQKCQLKLILITVINANCNISHSIATDWELNVVSGVFLTTFWCAVPENIHTLPPSPPPPTHRWEWNFLGGRGLSKTST